MDGEQKHLLQCVPSQAGDFRSLTPHAHPLLADAQFRTSKDFRGMKFLGPRVVGKTVVALVLMTLFVSQGASLLPAHVHTSMVTYERLRDTRAVRHGSRKGWSVQMLLRPEPVVGSGVLTAVAPGVRRALGAAAQRVQHDELPVHACHGRRVQLDRLHTGDRPGAAALHKVLFSNLALPHGNHQLHLD